MTEQAEQYLVQLLTAFRWHGPHSLGGERYYRPAHCEGNVREKRIEERVVHRLTAGPGSREHGGVGEILQFARHQPGDEILTIGRVQEFVGMQQRVVPGRL